MPWVYVDLGKDGPLVIDLPLQWHYNGRPAGIG
jgi:hypothetical protein